MSPLTAFPVTASSRRPPQKPLRLLTCALLIPASRLCSTRHDGEEGAGGIEPEMDGGIFYFLMAGTCWYISAQQRSPWTQLCNGLQCGIEHCIKDGRIIKWLFMQIHFCVLQIFKNPRNWFKNMMIWWNNIKANGVRLTQNSKKGYNWNITISKSHSTKIFLQQAHNIYVLKGKSNL